MQVDAEFALTALEIAVSFSQITLLANSFLFRHCAGVLFEALDVIFQTLTGSIELFIA